MATMNSQLGRLVCVVTLLMLLMGCGGPEEPLESRIRSLIETGREAAQDRNMEFFREVIDPEYSDSRGYGRAELLRMLTGYFYRNRSIYLVTRTEEIIPVEHNRARAVVYVGMAGSPVEGFEQLLTLRADLYRLELEFRLDEGLHLVHAQWRRANPEEVFSGL
jgi:hypothetical protein